MWIFFYTMRVFIILGMCLLSYSPGITRLPGQLSIFIPGLLWCFSFAVVVFLYTLCCVFSLADGMVRFGYKSLSIPVPNLFCLYAF